MKKLTYIFAIMFSVLVNSQHINGVIAAIEGKNLINIKIGDIEVLNESIAFPGAIGYGKNATGGKGGFIYHVTTLDDKTGPGTIRSYPKNVGPVTIVFDVSGYIDLNSQLRFDNDDITIAGQTAPNGGITFRGQGIFVTGSNIIIRHIRVRPGIGSFDDTDGIHLTADGVGARIENIIIDHVSVSFSRDENFGMRITTNSDGANNITLQNCMLAAPLDSNYNSLLGRKSTRMSIIENYFVHAKDRSPRLGYGVGVTSELINNLVYDYFECTAVVYGNTTDLIGNVYRKKAGSSSPFNPIRWTSGPDNPSGVSADGAVYGENNISLNSGTNVYNSQFPNKASSSRVMTDSQINNWLSNQNEIIENALNNSGANIYQDSFDAQMISDYRNGTGSYAPTGTTSEAHFGGYPTLPVFFRNSSDYESSTNIPTSFYLTHNLTGGDNSVRSNRLWVFPGKTVRNDIGLSNFEMWLNYGHLK